MGFITDCFKVLSESPSNSTESRESCPADLKLNAINIILLLNVDT